MSHLEDLIVILECFVDVVLETLDALNVDVVATVLEKKGILEVCQFKLQMARFGRLEMTL